VEELEGEELMPALKVSGLNFSYGAGPLIKELSFELRPGILCVLGPNGSGKSTLLKLLTGFIKAASGLVRLGGEEAAPSNRKAGAPGGLCG
jgi:ABC-type multidrug transport system ATPase subunit